jgi:hypothetical protein
LKLERSIGNLAKRLDRIDHGFTSVSKYVLSSWKDRPIIPIDEWIKLRNTHYAIDYFPDDFDQLLTYMSGRGLEQGPERRKDVAKWNADFLELMEYTKNSNYGKMKCFQCLLSPAGDDPIFIGINRLVAKGLVNGKHDPPQYPCEVVDRFQCPYERNDGKEIPFNADDLFRLHKLAFAIEISLAKARKEDSEIGIKNKEELLYTLTDKKIFDKVLEQGAEANEISEYIRRYLRENRTYILDYFMEIKDKVNMDELRFY